MAPCGRPIGRTRNDGCADQDEAVERVREEMMRLAEHVTQALHDAGLATSMHPPHRWAVGLGTNFVGDLQPLQPGDVTPVTWGDGARRGPAALASCLGTISCTGARLNCPTFARGVCDGRGRWRAQKPPHEATEEDLIEVWHDGAEFVGVHAADMDVTGGIGLKVQRLEASHSTASRPGS